MSLSLKNDDAEQFAIGEEDRDLRGTDALKGLDIPIDPDHLLHPGISVEPTVWQR